jgi:hypothetical protein
MPVLGIQARPFVAERLTGPRLIGVERVLHEARHSIDDGVRVSNGAAKRAADDVVPLLVCASLQRKIAMTFGTDEEREQFGVH